jgi:formylmethanofuran dehydrogenase subunit C
VSDIITLSLRTPPDAALDVDGVSADRLSSLVEREIAALPVQLGERAAHLGDFFTVRGDRSAHVRVEGPVNALANVHGLAAGSAGGEMVIDGNAGHRVGAGMTGGSVEVHGDVRDDAGMAMAGGTLRVAGNAGDRLGAAAPGASRSKGMAGGEIIVSGSAGSDVAARARRGLVVVGGHVGESAARAMIAGTLVVFGRIGAKPGLSTRRGSIVAVGGIAVPATYWCACTFRPPHVRLTMTYLRRRYGIAIDERVVHGRYRRYCGDAGSPDKGEILEWAGENNQGATA